MVRILLECTLVCKNVEKSSLESETNTSNALYNKAHSLIRKPYLAIITSNGREECTFYKSSVIYEESDKNAKDYKVINQNEMPSV